MTNTGKKPAGKTTAGKKTSAPDSGSNIGPLTVDEEKLGNKTNTGTSGDTAMPDAPDSGPTISPLILDEEKLAGSKTNTGKKTAGKKIPLPQTTEKRGRDDDADDEKDQPEPKKPKPKAKRKPKKGWLSRELAALRKANDNLGSYWAFKEGKESGK